jgi:hypothetical protein
MNLPSATLILRGMVFGHKACMKPAKIGYFDGLCRIGWQAKNMCQNGSDGANMRHDNLRIGKSLSLL